MKLFIFFLLAFVFPVQSSYAANCSAAMADCESKLAGRLSTRPDLAGHCYCTDNGSTSVGLAGWCDGWIIPPIPPCITTAPVTCQSGQNVGSGSNDYPLMGNYSTGCYKTCGVSCQGGSTAQLSCTGSRPPAYSSCTYTGTTCTGADDFNETAQPSPADCKSEGTWGIGWTKSTSLINPSDNLRPCVCDKVDLMVELTKRCGLNFAASALELLILKRVPGGGYASSGGSGTTPAGLIPGLQFFASECWKDPVQVAPTNEINCPYERIGNHCTVPQESSGVPEYDHFNCGPGFIKPFERADYCIPEEDVRVTKEIHTSYDSKRNSNNQGERYCPDPSTNYDGICWCPNGKIFIYGKQTLSDGSVVGGCDTSGQTLNEYDPEYNTRDNDPNNDNQSAEGYHVWVDNFSEVNKVLESMKQKQCGWDASNPCFVHVKDDTATQIRKVFVTNLSELLEPLEIISSDTSDLVNSNNQIASFSLESKNYLNSIERSNRDIVTALEGLNFCGCNDDSAVLQDIADNTGATSRNTENSLPYLERIADNSDVLKEEAAITNEKLSDSIINLEDLNSKTQDINDALKCGDEGQQDGLCDLLKQIRDSLTCTDVDGDKMCDVTEIKPPVEDTEEPPPEEEVPTDPDGNAIDFTLPDVESGAGKGTCPTFKFDFIGDKMLAKTYEIDMEKICLALDIIGYLMLAGAYMVCGRIIYRGVL